MQYSAYYLATTFTLIGLTYLVRLYSKFSIFVNFCVLIALAYLHYFARFIAKIQCVPEYERIVKELGLNARVYLLNLDIPNALVLGLIPSTEYILVLVRLEK